MIEPPDWAVCPACNDRGYVYTPDGPQPCFRERCKHRGRFLELKQRLAAGQSIPDAVRSLRTKPAETAS